MISKKKAKNYLEGCNSKTDFAAKLGYSYYNGRVGDKIDAIFEEYNLEPSFDRGKKSRKYKRVKKKCPVCGDDFQVKKDHPKERETCSHSCANKHFNHGNSEEAKKKKSESLKDYYESKEHCFEGLNSIQIGKKFSFDITKNVVRSSCKIHSYKRCKACKELFVRAFGKNNSKRKTCSKDCKNSTLPDGQEFNGHEFGESDRCFIHSYKNCEVCNELFLRANKKENVHELTCSKKCSVEARFGNRSYQNGSKNSEYYFNQNTNENVYLESSWEVKVAEKLDELSIEWIRPESIPWFDKQNKKCYYFPDFYLPNFDLYLDPKNPYCMDKDKEKMKKIEGKVDIEYGNLSKILNLLEKL